MCHYQNIVFVGGSITRGAGASAPSNGYAARIGQWFAENCGSEVTVLNISIGGTGSDFGAYRLEHDLHGFVPDMAFYEFTVNDRQLEEAYIRKNVEALIFKLRRINPDMLIFSVLTVRDKDIELYGNNTLPPYVDIHQRVAAENHIPVINVGKYLWERVQENGGDITEFLPAGPHPNDAGYQIYYEAVIHFLTDYLSNDLQAASSEPTPYNGDLANATLLDMSTILSTTCEKLTEHNEVRLLCSKGNVFSGSFTGNVLGIVGRMQKDGGRLKCMVDGGPAKNMDFWDNRASMADRTDYAFLFDSLERKEHTLSCSVVEEIVSNSSGRSEGYTVRVFYLLVNP